MYKSQLIIHTLSRTVSFTSEDKARASLLYSYKHSLNGFAALLSEEEATDLSGSTSYMYMCTHNDTTNQTWVDCMRKHFVFHIFHPIQLPI